MSNTSFELAERYPLKPAVDMTHDLSKGLQRHWPMQYDRLGKYRQKEPFPYLLAVMVVVGAAVLIRVVA